MDQRTADGDAMTDAANQAVILSRADYEAMVEALRWSRRFIQEESDSRANSGSPLSDYEQEPIDLLAAIDAALAKVDAL